jgi:hypothetical protein
MANQSASVEPGRRPVRVGRDCGHASVWPARLAKGKAVGDEVSCWSACGNVPTGRPREVRARHIASVEPAGAGS